MVDTPDRRARLSEVSPASRFDRLCDDFEAAWEAGREPRLGDYLVGLANGADETAVRQLLIELVKIDMYHRWQRAASKSETEGGSGAATSHAHGADTAGEFPSRPLARDYALRFPALGPPDDFRRICWNTKTGCELAGTRRATARSGERLSVTGTSAFPSGSQAAEPGGRGDEQPRRA